MHEENKLDGIRHSLAHLLAAAVLKKYPKAKLGIGPTIEHGFYYDILFPKAVSPEELKEFEKTMREFVRQKLPFSGRKVTPAEAKRLFKDQPFKLDLIKEFVKEKKGLTVYKTGDIFLDLCRGGHVKSTTEINPDAFALSHIAGAYWRGSEKNPMLTRIYGLAFATKKELDAHLAMLEEAKKRDHRMLGKQLKIYTFSDEVGQGLPLWLPNGEIIRHELEKWARETEDTRGYQHVVTPHITKSDLFKISGHLPYYKDDLYSPFEIEGESYYLKPMNCPFTHMIFKSQQHSYRDMPVRYSEYGQVYRYERSGVLHGLMRVRGFCQNDAHIYVQPEKAVEEFIRVLELHRYYYEALGIKDWWVVLGVRDPKNLRAKYHGDNAMWEKAERMTREALKKAGVKYEVEEGGAAHYGPKADIYIRSAIGKSYAIGTDQLDLYMPQRFNLAYTDKDGSEKMPYIIHRAPLGSHERMVGFLLEHYAGAFPTWLSPVQAKVLPVAEAHVRYAEKVVAALKEKRIRVELSPADETLGKRIRGAELEKVPYILVVGEKEESGKSVNVRKRHVKETETVPLEKFAVTLAGEIATRKR
ncbi:MAG: threonine--tRNA ligase [Candidatus Brennerbacteria bacterium]